MIAEFVSICINELGITIAHPEHSALLDSNFYLALAQHYGLPTNLLDLTVSPHVALFFAFDYADDVRYESDYVSLYQTHTVDWVNTINHHACKSYHGYDKNIKKMAELTTEYNFSSSSVYFPRLSTPNNEYNLRVGNQKGFFYFNNDAVPYDIVMYRLRERTPYQERRILINRDLKPITHDLLNRAGINRNFIYPSHNVDPLQDKIKKISENLIEKYL
ncbi:FRG domain-containing protein [Colwellia sp. MB02u-10]|jgi:hypothetical protein|nr:FRG domain-containing protein [Colwellia sp. MB02u-10]